MSQKKPLGHWKSESTRANLGGLTLTRAAQVDGVTLCHQELLRLIVGVVRNEGVALDKAVFGGARGAAVLARVTEVAW